MEIGIKEIGLSSSILNKIVIDNEADSFEFKLEIKIDGSLIYTTTLYCNDGGYASLYDLGSIVGHHMRMFIKRTVRLQVAAIFAKHTDTADVTVVYSELRFPFFSDLDFINSHFLTTRTYYTIPRTEVQKISFADPTKQSQPIIYNVAFRLNDNTVHTARLNADKNTFQIDKDVTTIIISTTTFKPHLSQLFPDDNPIILSGSITCGSRNIDFYFTDDKPLFSFSFLNIFNCWELYHVFGTQSINTDFTQKEATISGETTYYEQEKVRKLYIQTIPLTEEEAMWTNQFLGSQDTFIELPPHTWKILISDITSEISNSPKTTITIKFAWRFADLHNILISNDKYNQIFNDKFNETYQ